MHTLHSSLSGVTKHITLKVVV